MIRSVLQLVVDNPPTMKQMQDFLYKNRYAQLDADGERTRGEYIAAMKNNPAPMEW